ncbi:MAG: ribokinase [Dysgonamonadaceae bacterium]|nr:ribokinase [Dysgonamonadaceae bacterium]
MSKHRIKKILVVGSSNTDMVIKTSHLPCAGETVLGGTFFMNPGGKGANQAVAIARLGGQVTFICKTGNDVFGYQSHQLFEDEGIDVSYVFSDTASPSGVALIMVDENGENSIVVGPGANALLTSNDIAAAGEAIDAADFILMQLEIPLETVEFVAKRAAEKNKKVILNPAPARTLSKELLQNLYLITPNETEAELISGIKITGEASVRKAAERIVELGVDNVIITLGSKGAFVYSEGVCEIVPAFKVKVEDTTAAGDIFNGALTVALAENRPILDAVRFACKAAAISVTRTGAQSSAPYRNEVDVFNS